MSPFWQGVAFGILVMHLFWALVFFTWGAIILRYRGGDEVEEDWQALRARLKRRMAARN